MIGLALSGGGSRAIAFHLGCLRALHERRVLQKVSVISAVSGGSVIAGMYAYSNDDFEYFDDRIVTLLRRGLHWSILYHFLSPSLLARVTVTNFVSRPTASFAKLLNQQPPFRRWASCSDALEMALRDLIGDLQLSEIRRPNLDIVFNACELRTATAFRFGNRNSGTWRFGEIVDNKVSVAHAIACSAAYPLFLPAFDREYAFRKNGKIQIKRVIVADGGAFDNLGISCLEPGRNDAFSLHVYPATYLICCYAGYGQLSGIGIPFGFKSRVERTFDSVFRKLQDSALQKLHLCKRMGMIDGFILPYLGQQDEALPIRPSDLVPRNQVVEYPTNFARMSDKDIDRLTRRGEQLTRILLAHYCPEI
jgi:NTE family protein